MRELFNRDFWIGLAVAAGLIVLFSVSVLLLLYVIALEGMD
jgi:hypothetical protein